MSGRLKIPSADSVAIITNNTCNLTCNNCGTLQNYNFNDLYSWEQNAKSMIKWAEIAEFDNIDVLGGEPYLNPHLYSWAKNIKELWPYANVRVSTNGTLLHLDKNILLTRKLLNVDVGLVVSTHTTDEFDLHEQYLWNIVEPFKDKIRVEQNHHIVGDIMSSDIEKIWYYEDKIIFAHILVDRMFPNYVQEVKDNTVILDDGDPVKSHEQCIFNTQCYTIQDGLLYKCPLVFNYAIMKDLVNYEDRAYPLLDSYKACSPFDDIAVVKDFFNTLHHPIEACRLCAFDKKVNPTEQWVPVKMDKSMKKAFKGATK